jgi:hypothetical protein
MAEDKIIQQVQLDDGTILGPGDEQRLKDANVDEAHMRRFVDLGAIEGFGLEADDSEEAAHRSPDPTLAARRPKEYERQRGKVPVAGGPTDQE